MSASHLNFLAAAINAAIYVAFPTSALSFISVGTAVFCFGAGIDSAIQYASIRT